LLRELRKEGFNYKPFDLHASDIHRWVADGDMLVGPLTNLRGVGAKKAEQMRARVKNGEDLPAGMQRLVDNAETPYDDIFEGERRFGDIYKNPKDHNIHSGPVHFIKDIQSEKGTYVFIGRLREKNLRDLNEYQSVVKRGGREVKGQSLFLNFALEDDTDLIFCSIGRHQYNKLAKPIVEHGRIGKDWYLVKGKINNDWRKIQVEKIKRLS
jgi:hypothetical protein